MPKWRKFERDDLDSYAVGTWNLIHGFVEIETATTIAGALKAAADYVDGEEDISIVHVGMWVTDNGGDSIHPHDVTELYRLTKVSDDPSEED